MNLNMMRQWKMNNFEKSIHKMFFFDVFINKTKRNINDIMEQIYKTGK